MPQRTTMIVAVAAMLALPSFAGKAKARGGKDADISALIDSISSVMPKRNIYSHAAKIDTSYDKIEDKTTFSVGPARLSDSIYYWLASTSPGKSDSIYPGEFSLMFIVQADYIGLDNSKDVVILLNDSTRMRISNASYSRKMMNGAPVEFISMPIGIIDFVNLSTARSIDAKIKGKSVSFDYSALSALYDYASRFKMK